MVDDKYIAAADLVAQFSMADSALRMIALTEWQIGIGLAGTLGLLVTIFMAILSHGHAQAALRQQSEMNKLQLRGYLTFEADNADIGEDAPNKLTFKLVNNGNTPIQLLNIAERQLVRPTNSEDLDMPRPIPAGLVLGAGIDAVFPFNVDLGGYEDELERIQRLPLGGADLVIASRIDINYVDIFDEVHCASFGAEFAVRNGSLSLVRSLGSTSIRGDHRGNSPSVKSKSSVLNKVRFWPAGNGTTAGNK